MGIEGNIQIEMEGEVCMRAPSDESKADREFRIDKEQSDFYQAVMERFDGHCVVCYPMEPKFGGVTVHEIESKAQNPNGWWLDVNNGVTLCQDHHSIAHNLSTTKAREWLSLHIEKTLRSLHRL